MDITLIIDFFPKLISYLHITLLILVAAVAIGLIIGVTIALIRIYKVPAFNRLALIYISFMRGTPILIQLFLIYFGLPALLTLVHIDVSRANPLLFVAITYGLSCGASFAEIIRGAVNGVERGQTEAAYSIGMNEKQMLVRIILPQALAMAFPNFANSVIGSLKDTSLAFTIGVMDMVGRGNTLIASSLHALEVYMTLSIIYYGVVLCLEKGFSLSEKKLQRFEGSLAVDTK
ncbi:amino acid ABC transporter permease [Peribacillus loiseleuriae]|uniref:Cysteine ABC transporter permease n=1 Tax=Peribacillus loiseleuriae TaxID=1679170 RepID=A0A0K9GR71_9BACI|nr:amino acid ABC transporter permease [Peribacillus loiseleuriae]KMY49155.1 cysteine ABC transporter permease [Peribacillus loiseleuriae]